MLWYIYVQPLKRIGLVMLLLPVVWWLLMCLLGRSKRLTRTVNRVLGAAAAFGILYATLVRSGSGQRALLLMPLQSLVGAKLQTENYRMLLMNAFLFEPLGLFFSFAWGEKTEHPVRRTMLTAVLLSVMIEVLQFCFGIGWTETDDVLLNTLGAAIGTAAYLLWANCTGRKQ